MSHLLISDDDVDVKLYCLMTVQGWNVSHLIITDVNDDDDDDGVDVELYCLIAVQGWTVPPPHLRC